MYQRVKYDFKQELIKIKEAGLFKEEREDKVSDAGSPRGMPDGR